MNICIHTVPHESQRYPTCGDWQFDAAGDLCITVSSMGDWRKEALVAVHELVEALLCKERGISQEAVDAHDMAHPDSDDPAMEPGSPYMAEHVTATMIEQALCRQLGLDWAEYEEAVNRL